MPPMTPPIMMPVVLGVLEESPSLLSCPAGVAVSLAAAVDSVDDCSAPVAVAPVEVDDVEACEDFASVDMLVVSVSEAVDKSGVIVTLGTAATVGDWKRVSTTA